MKLIHCLTCASSLLPALNMTLASWRLCILAENTRSHREYVAYGPPTEVSVSLWPKV